MGACWLILFSLGWFFFAQWSNYLIGWFQESFCIPISQICSGWRYGLAIHQGSYHFRKCTCIIKLDSKCLAKADWSQHSFRWFILEANYAQTSKHKSKYIPVILSTKKLTRESPNIKILLKPWNCHCQDLGASRSSLIATKLTKPATSSTTWRRGNRSCRRQGQVTVGATNPRNPPRFRSWRLSHWPSRIFHKWRWSSCRWRWLSRGFPGNSLEVVERCGSQHLYTPSPFTGNLTKIHQIHKFDYLWTSFKLVC